jgi:hypothetical protein
MAVINGLFFVSYSFESGWFLFGFQCGSSIKYMETLL